MGTAIKHPVPGQVKPSFVIFDIRALYAQPWALECLDVNNYKWLFNPVSHQMLYSLHPYGNSERQKWFVTFNLLASYHGSWFDFGSKVIAVVQMMSMYLLISLPADVHNSLVVSMFLIRIYLMEQ